MKEEQQPPQENASWEDFHNWSTSTQAGIGATIIGAPLALALVEALGWGEVGLAVAALAAGGLGLGGKFAMSKYQESGGTAELPFVTKLRNANWKALFMETAEPSQDDQEEPAEAPVATNDTDIFAQPSVAVSSDVPGIRRITIEQMVKHTAFNSYEVFIGRSLTNPGNKAVKVHFHKRHIKIIGASQYGKSSMAAALLDAILQTHDPEHVIVALLDLEHKTSRLFADAPHIAEIDFGGRVLGLHARTYGEVLERLEAICALIDYRYTLSEHELDGLPILIAYLEEFIDLKDYFKHRVVAAPDEEKEQAKRDYTRLVYCIKKIAARGLKVYVQFLMCAQVDYRDDDLQEALINVTSGISFSVRPSAAKAAGFYQSELITRNAKDDAVGQAVVEMPDCKDLILAPEYDLKARLRALDAHDHPVYTKAATGNRETPVYTEVNAPVNGATGEAEPLPASARLRLLENTETPELEHKEEPSPVNNQTRETIKRLVEMGVMKHGQIAKAVKLDGRNYAIYRQVCRELGITTEREAS